MTKENSPCDDCQHDPSDCEAQIEDVTLSSKVTNEEIKVRMINCKYHKPLLKNYEQIEDLVCPICRGKKIVIHTISGDSWRAQCENHIWSCHVKTEKYTRQCDAIKAGKRLAKGIYSL